MSWTKMQRTITIPQVWTLWIIVCHQTFRQIKMATKGRLWNNWKRRNDVKGEKWCVECCILKVFEMDLLFIVLFTLWCLNKLINILKLYRPYYNARYICIICINQVTRNAVRLMNSIDFRTYFICSYFVYSFIFDM